MMKLRLKWQESVPAKTLVGERELEAMLEEVASEAQAARQQHLIEFQAENGNSLSIAVGGTETVLIFGCPENDPPYCTLRGPEHALEPVFQCLSLGMHPVEVPRWFVIPLDQGIRVLKAFATTGNLPDEGIWEET